MRYFRNTLSVSPFAPARGVVVACLFLAGCATASLTPPNHLLPIPKSTLTYMAERQFRIEQPIFIRIFKEESELEVWKQRADGTFDHLRTYPICTWSGELGPKLAEGDKQSPEGFYAVPNEQMNPHSKFHLAFNLGFPNAYDRSHGRTGSALMVHGKCKSVGCYAITDPYIEEVYALAREAFSGGQETIAVHVFPFRMTADAMARHDASPHLAFWMMLKAGYDVFETSRRVPEVAACDRRYVINPIWKQPLTRPLQADRACPAHVIAPLLAAKPVSTAQPSSPAIVMPGPKLRVAGAVSQSGHSVAVD